MASCACEQGSLTPSLNARNSASVTHAPKHDSFQTLSRYHGRFRRSLSPIANTPAFCFLLIPTRESIMKTTLHQMLNAVLAVCTVGMFWKGLACLTNSPHPIIVIASGSMEPAFHRGDMCLLWNRRTGIRIGEIPVVWFANQTLPMVHRVVEVHWLQSTKHQARST